VSESRVFDKVFYIAFAIVILVLISITVYAALPGATASNPGHSADQIYISYGSNYLTLQNAVSGNYLTRTKSEAVSLLTPANSDNNFPTMTPYHLASQILIQVPSSSGVNYTMTLQEAVDNNVFVNGASTSYTTSLPVGGQYASNVNVIGGDGTAQTFEQAIVTGNFAAPVTWNSTAWKSTYPVTCPTSSWTRTVYCQKEVLGAYITVDDSYCVDAGVKPVSSTTVTCTWHVSSFTCPMQNPSGQIYPSCPTAGTTCNTWGAGGSCQVGTCKYNCAWTGICSSGYNGGSYSCYPSAPTI
jgi:hypothetical protein